MAARVLSAIRHAITLELYGGFTTVIVDIFMMEAPRDIWGDEEVPVAPAVLGTIIPQ